MRKTPIQKINNNNKIDDREVKDVVGFIVQACVYLTVVITLSVVAVTWLAQ